MSWINKLERALQPFALPNLTLYLVIGQAFVYLTAQLGLLDVTRLLLFPLAVFQGEVWRVFTFVFVPPTAHWLWIAFALYFFYFVGTAMEAHWGYVKYNLFLLSGFFLTVGTAFLFPGAIATNAFIGGSVFLAFAFIHPNFVIHLFLLLPIKVKWIAAFLWALYALEFFTRSLSVKFMILAATGNFFLFFGRDVVHSLKAAQRRRRFLQDQAPVQSTSGRRGPRHTCTNCGKNSDSHPQEDFRYCSQCHGDHAYCSEHLRHHPHVPAPPASPAPASPPPSPPPPSSPPSS